MKLIKVKCKDDAWDNLHKDVKKLAEIINHKFPTANKNVKRAVATRQELDIFYDEPVEVKNKILPKIKDIINGYAKKNFINFTVSSLNRESAEHSGFKYNCYFANYAIGYWGNGYWPPSENGINWKEVFNKNFRPI